MANLPHYGLLVVFAPVLSLLAIKILLMAKAASMGKKPTEWFSRATAMPMDFPCWLKPLPEAREHACAAPARSLLNYGSRASGQRADTRTES